MKKSLQFRLQEYEKIYNKDPFPTETLEVRDILLHEITEERRKKWKNTVEVLDMRTNSNKAWRRIRKLNNEKRNEPIYTNMTANEVVSQLLLNSKTGKLKSKSRDKIIRHTSHETSLFDDHFTIEELNTGIKIMKKRKQQELTIFERSK